MDSPSLSPPAGQEDDPQKVQDDRYLIEADPAARQEFDPTDEAYETDADSRTSTSVSSSIRDYAFENNRRYHKFQEGRYHFPNDDAEQEREDMKHALIVNLCDGKLYQAPLQNPRRILDVGTGTGIWAIDMGDEHPEAEIIGIDLSPIQPSWVPPNVNFSVDDGEATWLWPHNHFDFVHLRFMSTAIKDWPALMAQAYDALAPGGWIEIQDMRYVTQCDDNTLKEDDNVGVMMQNIAAGLAALGVDLLGVDKNKQYVQDAGFVNVEEIVYKTPIGAWPRDAKMKTVGIYLRSAIYDGLHGITMGPLTRGLGWSPEQVELFLVGVRKALYDARVHRWLAYYIVYGQKPYV